MASQASEAVSGFLACCRAYFSTPPYAAGVRDSISCWAMGRRSVEAVNTRLALRARNDFSRRAWAVAFFLDDFDLAGCWVVAAPAGRNKRLASRIASSGLRPDFLRT